MSNSAINNLSTFKEQIGSIIKEINNFDAAEKDEALTFLRKCIDSDIELNPTSAIIHATETCSEKQQTNNVISSNHRISETTGDTQFYCEQCDKRFKRKCDLTRHVNTHNDSKPYKCIKCDTFFKQKGQLLKHEQNVHQNGESHVSLKKECVVLEENMGIQFNVKKNHNEYVKLENRTDEPEANAQDTSNLKQNDSNSTFNANNSSNLNTNTIVTRRPRRRVSFKPKLLVKFSNTLEKVKRAVLKCKICNITKKTKVALFQHLETHVGTPISCMKCRHKFNSRCAYEWHVTHMCKYRTKRVLKNKYKCSQCPKVFRFHYHYKSHVEAHTRNNCTYCDVVITHRKRLADHLFSVHSIKLERAKYKCRDCDKTYVKKFNYYNHLKQHAIGKHVCLECGAIIDSVEEYNKHMEVHRSQKRYQCHKCLDKFNRRQQLLAHLKKHEIYKCLTCVESFTSKVQLIKHKRRGHEVAGLEPRLRCPHCPRAFYRKLNWQIHVRKHTDDKPPITCKYCKKSFRTPYQYFNHLLTKEHEKKSPEINQLVCESCGKQFAKKYRLAAHFQRVHFPQKIYQCPYCDFKSNNKTNLQRHVSLHLTTKPEFVCELCGKGYNNLATLRDHVSYIHVQARQFKCDQCDKSFKRNAELNRHRTIHSDLRPHVCPICNVGYKRQTHLRRHQESAHGSVPKNRRVQRLAQNSDGTLVPIPANKKKQQGRARPKKSTAVSMMSTLPQPTIIQTNCEPTTVTEQQLFSIVNAQSGEMYTFTVPDVEVDLTKYQTVVYSQDLFAGGVPVDSMSMDQLMVNGYLPGDKGMQELHGMPVQYQDYGQEVAGVAASNLQPYGNLDPSVTLDATNNIIISSRLVENPTQCQDNMATAATLGGLADFSSYQRSANEFFINLTDE